MSGIDIPDLGEKIIELEDEIEEIQNTDPYQYQFLLNDDSLVKEKKEELEAEYREYVNYEKQLEGILEDLMRQGVTISWQAS